MINTSSTSNHSLALFSCLAGAFFVAQQLPAQNLLVNGDFSAGNTGFSSAYHFSTFNAGGGGEYTVTSNPLSWNASLSTPPTWVDHTATADNMSLLVNGNPTAGLDFWRETITVQPNTQYLLSGWATELYSGTTGSPGIIQAYIGGTATGTAFHLTDPANSTPDWKQFSVTFNSGNATSLILSLQDANLSWALNDFAVDDLSLVAVPEPGCAGLLVLGTLGLGLAARLRRSSQ